MINNKSTHLFSVFSFFRSGLSILIKKDYIYRRREHIFITHIVVFVIDKIEETCSKAFIEQFNKNEDSL